MGLWEAGGTQGAAVPPCLHPKLPGSVAGEPAVVRVWLCPLHRVGFNFAVGPNSLRRSPPTEILLQIWEQSVAVSFPSHGPDTQFAVAGGDPWAWGWKGGLSFSSLLCSLQGQLFSPFPAVYFQASGAPATPEKLVNVLVAPCLVCNKSMVLRSSGAGSHAVVSLA